MDDGRILVFFEYKHLPDRLQAISQPFCELAKFAYKNLPKGGERTRCLYKLLEAKDCAVRSAI